MNFLIILIALLIAFAVLIMTYKIGKYAGSSEKQEYKNTEHKEYLKELVFRDRQIQELQSKIETLNNLNSRYLSFTLKIPLVVQRLNATLDMQEIIASVKQLIKDVIQTDKVEIFMHDASDNMLKRFLLKGEEGEIASYAIGKGLIGIAGKDKMIRLKSQFRKNEVSNGASELDEFFSMAVPIEFKGKLLGVIGIGNIEQPTGNESNLMRMIADIAGVALINRELIGEAKQKADTDPLTGISNRNYFFQMAQNHVEKALRDRTPISIFLFDIDNFKHYNDTNGHDAGDRLLKELCELVSGITRKNSVFARYGGEEFIVLLPGISKEDAYIYAERVRNKISKHPFKHGEKQPSGHISISGGISTFPDDSDNIYKVIKLADSLLYKAKSGGRDLVLSYKPYIFSEQTENDNFYRVYKN
ncbi:MAG: diguanylate cyclase [Nitrospirae bacterium]|nr:diguanylate cyclase [Nitrospirota bacterium]